MIKYNRDRAYVIRKKRRNESKKKEEKKRRKRERTVFTSLKGANSRSGISFFPS